MSRAFASPKNAFGFCDRCGFRYPLEDLKSEVINLDKTPILSCPECWDLDNPQTQLGRYTFDDPQALRNPRPTGATSGGVDETNRWDFKTGVDYWVKEASHVGTVTWNSSSQTISFAGSSNDPRIVRTGYSGNPTSSATSIDANVVEGEVRYTKVRCRFRVTDRPDPLSAWAGSLFWGTAETDAPYPFSAAREMNVPAPDFNQMGNPWFLLTWDLSDNADWTNIITSLRIDFFDYQSLGSYTNGTVEIDYITAEKY